MTRTKTTAPSPTREKGQRSIDLPMYLDRIIPAYTQPLWWEADTWRTVVANQPFAVICRDILLSNILSLDWCIEPVESSMRDEAKKEIDYYTKFFSYTGDYDYSDIIEWVGADLLTIPFGGASEVGRENDEPDGKVLWMELLDGATLYPTLNDDFPVGQTVKEMPGKSVYFPYYAINRIYTSPRTEIKRKGWGMAPPEKIYLALELLRRGDYYYANLLLDTPEAGILDLMDMEKDSAEEWVSAWRELLTGIDPFKVPVLYEHDNEAKWIPFTRAPADIMFDKAILKYAGIVVAGYGLSPSDVGFSPVSSGGETLAGSIRQERKTRKTGVSKLKKRFHAFFNRMLPEYLEFKFIDLDDELSVALGRARLATATAMQIFLDKKILVPNEARQQIIADGLISISIPESIEGGDKPFEAEKPSDERPALLGKPIAPSQGGYGEIKSEIDTMLSDNVD